MRDAKIDTPQREARWLLAHVADVPASDLLGMGGQDVPQAFAERFRTLANRRASREPLQHILGTTEFYGLEFISDARALVPRPDSEVVVEAALNLLPSDMPCFVADLGTGSGCLLAAILANRPHAMGTGVEADADAASLACENLAQLGLSARSDVFKGSWVDWPDWGRASLIVSNPPYIASAEISSLMPEVRLHDPHAALDGGEDGLLAYREIIACAAQGMAPGAWLVFEIGHDQREAVSGLLGTAGFDQIGAVQDLGGNDRVVWAQRANS